MSGPHYIAAEVVDQARARTGCTSDEQLAVKLGVSGGTIARIRRGAQPSFATAIRLLEAAGTTVAGVRKHPAA